MILMMSVGNEGRDKLLVADCLLPVFAGANVPSTCRQPSPTLTSPSPIPSPTSKVSWLVAQQIGHPKWPHSQPLSTNSFTFRRLAAFFESNGDGVQQFGPLKLGEIMWRKCRSGDQPVKQPASWCWRWVGCVDLPNL
jgi:hypothetical protein